MMVDNIALSETLPANTGFEDASIPLSVIGAALQDTDGSETLNLSIGAIPVGATLTDGSNRFTADQNPHNSGYYRLEPGQACDHAAPKLQRPIHPEGCRHKHRASQPVQGNHRSRPPGHRACR